MQQRGADSVERAWCGRGLRDRRPSTTGPTARSPPPGARATGRRGGASTPSRSHRPSTSSARLVDRTATGATRQWRRQRATASRRLAGPTPARTLTHSQRDTSSYPSDAPSISCRDRAPAAVNTAREPTVASSKPKGCAPTPAGCARSGSAVECGAPDRWARSPRLAERTSRDLNADPPEVNLLSQPQARERALLCGTTGVEPCRLERPPSPLDLACGR